MKAVLYRAFSERPEIENLPDPVPRADAVVLKVMASGVCLSDWHGWQGNDPDIELPHVPGHELAGVVEAVGDEVKKWQVGDRVTVPFVCGCGKCPECHSGNHQVCDYQFQPGFTHWGSFAEYVAIHYADVNLVRLPQGMEFQTAASLGCRFATVVHGCGGVGLSAIMIACALGAKVVAVDLADDKLEHALRLGAVASVNARSTKFVADAIREVTDGGAHVSVDAIGNASVCRNSIDSLRKRGRHIQIGLMVGENSRPEIPMGKVLSNELEMMGSHGMQAHRYAEMLEMISAGRLAPEKLIGRTISLEESIDALTSMSEFGTRGVTVITEF